VKAVPPSLLSAHRRSLGQLLSSEHLRRNQYEAKGQILPLGRWQVSPQTSKLGRRSIMQLLPVFEVSQGLGLPRNTLLYSEMNCLFRHCIWLHFW